MESQSAMVRQIATYNCVLQMNDTLHVACNIYLRQQH